MLRVQASRRASLAAHGPAGCDPQVLQLAVGSGRGGEGGGRADNSPAPPLLSPQVGYLVYWSEVGGGTPSSERRIFSSCAGA